MKKIAVPIQANHNINEHFGSSDQFIIYTINTENKISGSEIFNSTNGCGCKSDLASQLSAKGVSIMLASGMGAGAVNVLTQSGISVVRGCSGNAELLVKQYLNNELADSGSSCHHDHHHDGQHQCNH
ncbi:MAG: NifB/NifX family molybdenum-iron cluster-binding protein [Bacteroidales bacterium]|nr:NifB/NifX family molybdenum-iron cluster-binding protein [Bacteroidales bacterium]